ncbi:glycosyltransferase family 4 protein, partial [Klebsiella pneumoniae]
PGYIPPLHSKNPYVFTIHDLNHLDRDDNSSFFKKLFYNTVIKHGCTNAKFIFTVSEFSRQRILAWSGVNENKVINVGNGVSPDFSPHGEKIDLGFDFLLCVSNRKGHKNEMRTLEAFKLSNMPQSYKLVFTGGSNESIKKKIDELGISDRVYFTGYLKDAELPKLYRAARALIFVSLYEGFGLPVVEAQASGIPVITSNGSSLSEVAGSAALFVNPESVMDIANAITTIFTDSSVRDTLINSGFHNAKRYSWENTAGKIDEYLNLAAEM